MKKYTVRYSIGAYVYESVIHTSSSNGALRWVEAIGGYNPTVVKEEEVE
jgi:ribosomal protein S16